MESGTNVRFGTISARTFARESTQKKHITVIAIIRAHRGRDFTCGLTGIRELRAPIANLRRHREKNRKNAYSSKNYS